MKKILIALLCTLCIKVSAQTINTRLDSLFDYCHKNFLFNGTVLISENGKIVFSKAYGEADVQNKAPNTMSTKFQLGAISKQFTAFIILKLVDEGKIDLNKPAFAYLGYEDRLASIHVKNLLTHTSGLRDYTTLPEFNDEKLYTHEELLDQIINAPLVFSPGSNYRYSNSNFFVLALIAEKVTGKNFETLLNDIILSKAGMRNSGEDNDGRHMTGVVAHPYLKSYNKLVPANPIEVKNVVGSSGVYSTANDMLLWSAFFQNAFSTNSRLNKFIYSFSNHNPAGYYSSGWFVEGGHLFHEGHIKGFSNLISIDTSKKQTIIILSNSDFRYLYITMLSTRELLDNYPNALKWLGNKTIDPKDYLGKYQVANIDVQIKEENGQLVGDSPTGRIKLVYFDNDKFFLNNREAYVVFKRDNNGHVVSFASFEDYEWVELKKIE